MVKIPLAEIQVGHFERLRDEEFEFQSSGGNWRMKLIEVARPVGLSGAGTLRAPFSLLFVNLESEPLNDRVCHRIRCNAFESDEILLSRVVVPRPEPGKMYYEAIFG